jgi:hypothetical protein
VRFKLRKKGGEKLVMKKLDLEGILVLKKGEKRTICLDCAAAAEWVPARG